MNVEPTKAVFRELTGAEINEVSGGYPDCLIPSDCAVRRPWWENIGTDEEGWGPE